jgi:DNA polymerase III sliding clamp (beta) subunit (PCNA family)
MYIKDTESFKKSIDQLATIVEEGNLHISISGISVIALDKTNVIFLKIHFPETVIENGIDPIAIGLNFQELNKIVSKIGNDEKITLALHETEVEIKADGAYKRNYFIPIIDVKEPSLEFKLDKYSISLSEKGQILRDMFRSASTVATSLAIKADEKITLLAEGIGGRFLTKIDLEKHVDPFSVRFSTLQLFNLIKNANDDVTLKLGNNSPLYGTYKIGDVKIEFLLAHMLI